MGIIYMIRNMKNDKRYIGQSIQPVEKRFRQHIEGAYLKGRRTYNTCLSRAIRKYGSDFFELGIDGHSIGRDRDHGRIFLQAAEKPAPGIAPGTQGKRPGNGKSAQDAEYRPDRTAFRACAAPAVFRYHRPGRGHPLPDGDSVR